MANACFDFGFTSSVKSKLAFLINKKCDDSNRNETINILLDDLIARFHITKQKEGAELPVEFYQDLIIIGAQLIEVVSYHESFKIAKVCQVWEQVVLLPNIVLPASVSESLVNWILLVLKYENHGNAMIFHDVLNCLSSAVRLKEVKQTKNLDQILGESGLLLKTIKVSEILPNSLLALKIFCNFTHCPGEKDWSCISRDLIQTFTLQFIHALENNLNSDPTNSSLLKMLVLCFHGLENIFVRFCSSTNDQLSSILGLAKCYVLFGVPGHRMSYSPILPSSVPFTEIPSKMEQGKTPKLRKKRQPKTGSKKGNTSFKEEGNRQEEADTDTSYQIQSKVWKLHAASSSDSEMSDSEGQNLKQLKENQAKVRACALKMLTAAFKFCEQRTVMSYWSSFLPDSSPGHVFRHSLLTPILKDPSVKVRCCALVSLSTLIQTIQPTLAMASYQENRMGSFIPFSHTVAETVVAVQRSLLLSLSAEQSTAAFIQLFKCLTSAASVFPYEKLPIELVSKTVHQCSPFLEHKDPDVKVACLSVLRVLICTHSSHSEIVKLFWDEASKKCWLLEHCLSQIEAPCGFPLTLESLLVIGEVTRCNIELAQLYMEKIVKCICLRLLQDTDPGIQIRCAKALSLVCSSILQEMEKEECQQAITRDEAVQLWTHILRHGIAEIFQATTTSSPLRAEACAALATVGSQIFECLPRDLRILFATLTLGCASDLDAGVRAAAIRTLGFAVTFNTLNDDASFLMDCSELILLLLKDSNLLVALNSSWALGNLADTLDKNKDSLLEELPTGFLVGLIEAAINASQGPIKVRCNGFRALGIFLKIVKDIPTDGDRTAVLFDQGISIIVKQATTGNFMKNRWNACYAVGNVFQNVDLMTAFSHWMEQLVDCLLTVFRTCSNFKVRISAANAMLHLNNRQLLSTNYMRIWISLLDTLATSEQILEFSEFQHHETMCRQICNTLCKLMILMTKEDLSQLQDIVIKYYDICSEHFSKFLKSLLPDQLELVMEALNYIQQFGPDSSLSASQQSTLTMLKELLNLQTQYVD